MNSFHTARRDGHLKVRPFDRLGLQERKSGRIRSSSEGRKAGRKEGERSLGRAVRGLGLLDKNLFYGHFSSLNTLFLIDFDTI